jgi:Domain of unknown function (DUF4166)
LLYRQLLGADFDKLPRALREFHSKPGGGRAVGTAAVRHTNKLLAWLVGLPAAGDNVPIRLEVVADDNQEVWTRRFGNQVRRSVQWRNAGLLVEAAGPVRVSFRIQVEDGVMRFESQRARLWMIPLPLRVSAIARGNESSWEAEVNIAHLGWYRAAMVPTP